MCDPFAFSRVLLSFLNAKRITNEPASAPLVAPLRAATGAPPASMESASNPEVFVSKHMRRAGQIDLEVAKISEEFTAQARRDRTTAAGRAKCKTLLAKKAQLLKERALIDAAVDNVRKASHGKGTLEMASEFNAVMTGILRQTQHGEVEKLKNTANEVASDFGTLLKAVEEASSAVSSPIGATPATDRDEERELERAFAAIDEEEEEATRSHFKGLDVPLAAPKSGASPGGGGGPAQLQVGGGGIAGRVHVTLTPVPTPAMQARSQVAAI
jgi:hypothetical protein